MLGIGFQPELREEWMDALNASKQMKGKFYGS